jgi:hypothetical protein
MLGKRNRVAESEIATPKTIAASKIVECSHAPARSFRFRSLDRFIVPMLAGVKSVGHGNLAAGKMAF